MLSPLHYRSMSTIITTIHIIVSILLMLTILLQHRASGLSATFGGSGAVPVQRRGAEKAIFYMSVWLAVAFFALTILQWYI